MRMAFPAPSSLGKASVLVQPLAEAIATLFAAIATLLCTLPLTPGPGPAVLAVVLVFAIRNRVVARRAPADSPDRESVDAGGQRDATSR